MDMFDEIINQLKDNNKSDNDVPWTFENIKNSTNSTDKFDIKKYAKLGIIILFCLIVGITIFNYFSNINSVSVTTQTDDQEKQEDKKIQVHITGQVINPGLYKLEPNSRVWDAIQAAGGFTELADQSSLNLAKNIEDGEQLCVGEQATQTSNAQTQQENSTASGKVNINTADITTLQTLSGVGPSTAQKIIDYRNSNGKFKKIDDIKNVSGIGDKTFAKFKDKICV